MFSYRDYDGMHVSAEERERIEAFDRENDRSKLETKVYAWEFDYHPYSRSQVLHYQQLCYQKVPKYENLDYVPAPFRERFEIWLWKVEELGIAKIKNNYFTPDVSIFQEVL